MKEPRLKGLCKAYAAGELNRQQYLRQRAALLDALGMGKNPASLYSEPQGETDEDKAGGVAPLPQGYGQGQEQRHRKSRGLLISLGILTLLLLGVLFMLYRLAGNRAAVPKATAVAERPGNIPGPAVESPETRLRSFAEKGDWSVAAVSLFQKTWDGLSPEEQKAFRSAPWFETLRARLSAHLQTQESLTDDSAPDPAVTFLLNFAAHIGLDENSHDKSD